MAHQQKLKADKKALEQAKAKASQKGPMGMLSALFFYMFCTFCFNVPLSHLNQSSHSKSATTMKKNAVLVLSQF